MIVPLKQGRQNVEVAPKTGPLHALAGRTVLILVDDENLRASAEDLGYRLSYRSLGAKIGEATSQRKFHIFFAREANDYSRTGYFENRGMIPHPRDIHVVQSGRGIERTTNSDFMIAFHAGILASRSDASVIVIASGDGKLVWDIAEAVRGIPKEPSVMTLSLAGSTAWRLNAANNKFIDVNIEIGLDCLRQIDQRQPYFHRPRFSAYGTHCRPEPNSIGIGLARHGLDVGHGCQDLRDSPGVRVQRRQA